MKKDVVIQMSNAMEATPIAHLVQLANQFDSRVYFEMDNKRVNAKSIMGMMSLVLSGGSMVTIDAEGEDEDKAIHAMENFLTT
ncbi:MAG: HPr family phosphocarrier protein [Lachnospiraceae bacterium]|nr:HPr family phosphocarrier protein [Lachnospiraceae bacterium]